MERKEGLYFETKTELFNNTSNWLALNGFNSVLTSTCVSLLGNLTISTTFEQDLSVIMEEMQNEKAKIMSMDIDTAVDSVESLLSFHLKNEFVSGIKSAKLKYKELIVSNEITGNTYFDTRMAVLQLVDDKASEWNGYSRWMAKKMAENN